MRNKPTFSGNQLGVSKIGRTDLLTEKNPVSNKTGGTPLAKVIVPPNNDLKEIEYHALYAE